MQPGEVGQGSEENTAEPDLILAIEEPELYQHPTKQRHFARVLDALSSGNGVKPSPEATITCNRHERAKRKPIIERLRI